MVEHLGVLIDTRQMRVFVTDRKVKRMRKMAQEILLHNGTGDWSQWGSCDIPAELLCLCYWLCQWLVSIRGVFTGM